MKKPKTKTYGDLWPRLFGESLVASIQRKQSHMNREWRRILDRFAAGEGEAVKAQPTRSTVYGDGTHVSMARFYESIHRAYERTKEPPMKSIHIDITEIANGVLVSVQRGDGYIRSPGQPTFYDSIEAATSDFHELVIAEWEKQGERDGPQCAEKASDPINRGYHTSDYAEPDPKAAGAEEAVMARDTPVMSTVAFNDVFNPEAHAASLRSDLDDEVKGEDS